LLLTVLFLCASCANPLGPGYAIKRQSLDLRYAAADADRVHVHLTYRLQNSGDRDLNNLQVMLPAPLDLQARLDGNSLAPETTPAPRRGSVMLTIPFNPPWRQKAFHDLDMEYDLKLAAPPPGVSHPIEFEQAAEWFPELRTPTGLFATGPMRGKTVEVSIQVPEGYRALASGQELNKRARAGEIDYRYRLRSADFDPFVVIGHYQERQVAARKYTMDFWTLEALPSEKAQPAADAIAATVQTYERIFGPRAKKTPPLWIIETAMLPGGTGSPGPSGASFPNTALLNRAAFDEGLDSAAFQDLAAEQLAKTWFNWITIPTRSLPPDRNLGSSLARYAVIVAAQARSGDAERQRRVAKLLQQFDELTKNAPDRPLLSATFNDSPEQREAATEKGTLFIIAIEDACGQEPARRGIASMVAALRGEDYGLAHLRSAIEGEAHKDLADLFRAWLDHTGIPADFRARYSAKPAFGESH